MISSEKESLDPKAPVYCKDVVEEWMFAIEKEIQSIFHIMKDPIIAHLKLVTSTLSQWFAQTWIASTERISTYSSSSMFMHMTLSTISSVIPSSMPENSTSDSAQAYEYKGLNVHLIIMTHMPSVARQLVMHVQKSNFWIVFKSCEGQSQGYIPYFLEYPPDRWLELLRWVQLYLIIGSFCYFRLHQNHSERCKDRR